jgi:hypothetical protein
MKNFLKVPRGVVVALVFAGFIAVSLLVAYVTSGLPSPHESCAQKCATLNKRGELAYKGPATSRDFYKEANSVCECR